MDKNERFHGVENKIIIAIALVMATIAGLFFFGWLAYRHSTWSHEIDSDVTNDPKSRKGIQLNVQYSLPPGLSIRKSSGKLHLREARTGVVDMEVVMVLDSKATMAVNRVVKHESSEYTCLIVYGKVTQGEVVYENVEWWWPRLTNPIH